MNNFLFHKDLVFVLYCERSSIKTCVDAENLERLNLSLYGNPILNQHLFISVELPTKTQIDDSYTCESGENFHDADAEVSSSSRPSEVFNHKRDLAACGNEMVSAMENLRKF